MIWYFSIVTILVLCGISYISYNIYKKVYSESTLGFTTIGGVLLFWFLFALTPSMLISTKRVISENVEVVYEIKKFNDRTIVIFINPFTNIEHGAVITDVDKINKIDTNKFIFEHTKGYNMYGYKSLDKIKLKFI